MCAGVFVTCLFVSTISLAPVALAIVVKEFYVIVVVCATTMRPQLLGDLCIFSFCCLLDRSNVIVLIFDFGLLK